MGKKKEKPKPFFPNGGYEVVFEMTRYLKGLFKALLKAKPY